MNDACTRAAGHLAVAAKHLSTAEDRIHDSMHWALRGRVLGYAGRADEIIAGIAALQRDLQKLNAILDGGLESQP